MPSDLAEIAERSAALEARVEELTRAFHDHVEREEENQDKLLQELSQIRQIFHTARTMGRATIWLGGAILAVISGIPVLIQWVHDHVTLKP